MIFQLYSVHDSLANIYYMPFQTAAVQVAIRTFTDLVNDQTNTVYKNPSDYNLMHLGSFDDSTGLLNPLDKPAFVVNARQLHEEYQNEIGNGSSV